jgi:hypothetical protein
MKIHEALLISVYQSKCEGQKEQNKKFQLAGIYRSINNNQLKSTENLIPAISL